MLKISEALAKSVSLMNSALKYVCVGLLLFMMGLDVPLGLDGRVLEGIFDENHLRQNPVRYRGYDLTRMRETGDRSYDRVEDVQKIETVLRGLGYLD